MSKRSRKDRSNLDKMKDEMKRKKEKAEELSKELSPSFTPPDVPESPGADGAGEIDSADASSGPIQDDSAASGIGRKMDLVVFQVGQERFAFSLTHVREIVRMQEMRAVPNPPANVVGVCSLRGSILPVIDLRQCFRLPPKKLEEGTRMIVAEVHGCQAGLIADRILEVSSADVPELLEPPSHLGQHEYVTAIIMKDSGLIIVLDAEKFIRIEQADLGAHELASAVDLRGLGAGLDQPDRCEKEAAQPASSSAQEQAQQKKIVVFRLGDDEYGIDIDCVREIHYVDQVVHMPGTSGFLSGMVHLRGEMIPLVNMRALFGISEAGDLELPGQEEFSSSKFLVVEHRQERIGMLIDSVSEIVSLNPDDLESVSRLLDAGSGPSYIHQVCKWGAGKRTIMMVHLPAVLEGAFLKS